MNKNLYSDDLSNALRVSKFSSYAGETNFQNVAAKFVVQGKESYVVNNKKFQVNPGEYIIGNNNQLSEVIISENTIGICVDVSSSIVSEIVETVFENADFKEFLLSDSFLINKYTSGHTNLGRILSQLSTSLLDETSTDLLCDELFYSIGEHAVNDQALVFEQLSKLNFKKREVNEETFRNLLRTKHYIDDCYLDHLSIDDLVHVAHISKYALIRQFKTTFGITPYHYILNKRLVYAKAQLRLGVPVFDVAIASCFADAPSFSRAFKQHFGVPPSSVSK